MPLLSAFTPCGLLELSGETSDAENIYTTLKTQLGTVFDLSPGTYEEAKIYAVAMQIAWARAIIKRVPREMHPLTCYDMLTTLEKDWACTPSARDTLYLRQLRIAARKLLMRGSREEAIVTDLLSAIGSDFIKLNAMPSGSAANFPTTPSTVGTFPNPAIAPKFYKLLDAVSTLTVRPSIRLQCINESAYPLVGEKLTIQPECDSVAESITVAIVTPIVTSPPTTPATCSIVATTLYAHAHSPGAWALTACPRWLSNRMQLQVVVSVAASTNAEKRRKINDTMARHCRTTERWKICAVSSSTTIGPLVVGVGHNIVGATALGATATPF